MVINNFDSSTVKNIFKNMNEQMKRNYPVIKPIGELSIEEITLSSFNQSSFEMGSHNNQESSVRDITPPQKKSAQGQEKRLLPNDDISNIISDKKVSPFKEQELPTDQT